MTHQMSAPIVRELTFHQMWFLAGYLRHALLKSRARYKAASLLAIQRHINTQHYIDTCTILKYLLHTHKHFQQLRRLSRKPIAHFFSSAVIMLAHTKVPTYVCLMNRYFWCVSISCSLDKEWQNHEVVGEWKHGF